MFDYSPVRINDGAFELGVETNKLYDFIFFHALFPRFPKVFLHSSKYGGVDSIVYVGTI